jgi:CHASE3 domain sensor protein
MPLTFERKLTLALFLVLIVLTVLGIALYQHTMTVQDNRGLGQHTRVVLANLDELQTRVQEIDFGLRGSESEH